jgi:hypothetical protein
VRISNGKAFWGFHVEEDLSKQETEKEEVFMVTS